MTACSPYPSPRLAERTAKNPSKMLRQLTQFTLAQHMKDRKPIDVSIDLYRSFLGKIGLGDSEDVLRALEDVGLIIDANGVPQTLDKVDIDTLAPTLAAVKTWYQGVGRGLQEMADNFTAKVYSGEDVVEAGLQFAKQARGISDVGHFILQSDRKLGQGLYVQRFQDPEFSEWAKQRFGIPENELRTRAIKGAQDWLTRAGNLMNQGKVDEGLDMLMGYAQMIKFQGEPENAARFAKIADNLGDMIWTVAINGMLSSPATASTNFISGIYAVTRPLFTLAGSLGYQMVGAPGLKNEAKQAAAEAAAALVGMQQASFDALKILWWSFVHDKTIYTGNFDINAARQRMQGGWNASNINGMLPDGAQMQEGDGLWDLVNMAGSVLTAPSRFLSATDDAVKHLSIRGQVQANAISRLIKEAGPDALRDKAKVAEYVKREQGLAFDWSNPNLDKKWELRTIYDQYARTMGEAKYVTFQEDNEVAAAVSKVLSTQYGKLLRPFVPFVRTPTNILKQGFIDSTVIGSLVRARQIAGSQEVGGLIGWHEAMLKSVQSNPVDFFRHAGTVAFTSVLAGVVYQQVVAGNMVGGGPRQWLSDKTKWEQDRFWNLQKTKGQGFRTGRYEVKLPGGGVWDFSRFGEPFAAWAKMVADLAEFSGYISDQEKEVSFGLLAVAAAKGLAQGSFLQGIQNLIDIFDGSDEGMIRAAQGYVGVFQPFGGLLGYVSQLENKNREVVYGWEGNEPMSGFSQGFWPGMTTFWDAMSERWQQRMPGYGNNPVLRDPVFGEPVPIAPGMGPESGLSPLDLALPFLPRGQAEQDSLYEDIYRLTGGYRPYRGPTDLKLTVAEQMRLYQLQGQVLINGRSKAEAFRLYLSKPEVKAYMYTGAGANRQINLAFEREFKKLDRQYGKLALGRLLLEDPEIRARYALAKQRKQLEKLKDPRAVDGVRQVTGQIEELYVRARMRQRGENNELTTPVIPAR